MKRRIDRLLSSQTAVGGRRPGAAGGRYISLACGLGPPTLNERRAAKRCFWLGGFKSEVQPGAALQT